MSRRLPPVVSCPPRARPLSSDPLDGHPAAPHISIDRISYTAGIGTGRRAILSSASLRVASGEWVAVMGPSGCGKSTLLHMVGGLRRPDEGSVAVGGVEISALSDRGRAQYRCREIGFIFQQYNLIDDLSVRRNVELPLLLLGTRRSTARRTAAELLDRVGLSDRAGSWPAELSGGEQQRVAIVRALAARHTVLLADEPTGALDSSSAGTVIDLLAVARDQGRTILMVTHDPTVARAADRVVWMRDGTIEAIRSENGSPLSLSLSLSPAPLLSAIGGDPR